MPPRVARTIPMKTKLRRSPPNLTDRITMRLEPALLQAVIRYARTKGYGRPSVIARAALTAFLKEEGYLTDEELLRDESEGEAPATGPSAGKGR